MKKTQQKNPAKIKLQDFLLKNNITVELFSRTVGLSRTTITDLMHKPRIPGLIIAYKIYDLTGIDPREWLSDLWGPKEQTAVDTFKKKWRKK